MSTCVMSMIVSKEVQGIGSVLGSSDYQRSKTAASLRRTLSADMSSKKWLAKNGFCPLKKIASSEDLQFDDKKEEEPPGQSDIWSSIISQKSSSSSSLSVLPYVHPLAKPARSLSQQSLEICTESLGSETGSDGFSSVPSLADHAISSDDDEEEVVEQVDEQVKEIPVIQELAGVVISYNSYAIKKSFSPSRSFPPPLPSLSQSHMRSHRVNGRLVVEAIATQPPTQNYFQAQREGGRLQLTLANPKYNDLITKEFIITELKTKSSQKDEEDEVNNEFEEVEEEEEEEEDQEDEDEEEIGQVSMDRGIVLEMKVNQPTGVINVHRSALMVNKLMGLTNRDPSWSPKLEKIDQTTLAHSLPPSQLVSRLIPSAASFNTYDYCWRTKSPAGATTPTVCTHPLTQNTKTNKFLVPKNMNPQDLLRMRGNKADYLVPIFKGCKEPRRSLLVWEPYCIATS